MVAEAQGDRVVVGLLGAALLLLDDVAPDGAGDLERKPHGHGLVGSLHLDKAQDRRAAGRKPPCRLRQGLAPTRPGTKR